MNFFSRMLIGTAILLLTGNIYAQTDIVCPAVPVILAHAKFIKAQRGLEGSWSMFTKAFEDNNTNWDILFTTQLPAAHTPAAALEQGQAYFQQTVTLNEPIAGIEMGLNVCIYAQHTDYVVLAINPPISLPGLTKLVHN